jgi:hypothetical protein
MTKPFKTFGKGPVLELFKCLSEKLTVEVLNQGAMSERCFLHDGVVRIDPAGSVENRVGSTTDAPSSNVAQPADSLRVSHGS